MLEEWRPLLCPFDTSLADGVGNLSFFLPTCLPPEHHHKGFKCVVCMRPYCETTGVCVLCEPLFKRLWFEELLKMWLGLHYGTPATEVRVIASSVISDFLKV